MFQHTAARRRLAIELTSQDFSVNVSTHSRPKAAGPKPKPNDRRTQQFQHTAARRRLETVVRSVRLNSISFNTQPPEGGWQINGLWVRPRVVSTHSRPKAAGLSRPFMSRQQASFNTQPPEGGWAALPKPSQPSFLFQHTAARRRLARFPKCISQRCKCFNTQPPEGGWLYHL